MRALAVPGTSNQTFGGRSSSGSGLRASGEGKGLRERPELGVPTEDEGALEASLDMLSYRGNTLVKSESAAVVDMLG